MSKSPNIDNQKAKTTPNPKDISSPLQGDSGFVEFEKSDLRPERIERLGQYLSNTTQNVSSADERNATAYGNTETSKEEIPHQSGKNRADYVVSSPDQTAVDFKSDLVSEALEYFQNLSDDIETFPADTVASVVTPAEKVSSPNLKYGNGHRLLNNKAPEIISKLMDDGSGKTMQNSRWAGIGEKRFLSGSYTNYPNVTERLDNSRLESGTSFGGYTDPAGQGLGSLSSEERQSYWDDYFERLAKFGPAMQHKAANMPLSQGGFLGRTARTGTLNPFGGPEEQLGTYKKIDMAELDARTIWDDTEDSIDGVKINHMHSHNSSTYGQLHTHMAPFNPEGFVVGDSGSITTLLELTSIFLQMSIQITLTTAVLEIANYMISNLVDGDPNGLWENSYYPRDPQRKDPRDYRKGFSGYRHPLSKLGEDAIESGVAPFQNADQFAGVAANQLLGGVIRKGLTVLDEEVLNFTQVIARDLNLYIPRHHLTQMRNETGYNERTSDTVKNVGLEAVKVVDIGTAYIRSCTAGFGIVAANILGEFNSKSIGFYKNWFRDIVRSVKGLEAERANDSVPRSVYQSLMLLLGQENKLIKFMNYLCIIGDTSVATSSTGRMPFPENKVPLGDVGNHPSLRTASTRRKHSQESRLSLGSLPSMMLKPKNAFEIRQKLIQSGLGDSTYGQMSGKNELHVQSPGETNRDTIKELIGEKYQAGGENGSNRFSPKQVKLMEDQLEAEHMPFYIQDLRTNEIIAFHAFLNSLSDSYSADWSAQKGFGRLEAAQIYGGGSRSIGLSFTMVAMNPEDFDEMYVKINKLTTLVYPQWSEGTLMQQGENRFVQPFSQVPTASPLCRLRVGEIFASNYSKKAMARMMGIGNPKFQYEGISAETIGEKQTIDKTGEVFPSQLTWKDWLSGIREGLKTDELEAYNEYIKGGGNLRGKAKVEVKAFGVGKKRFKIMITSGKYSGPWKTKLTEEKAKDYLNSPAFISVVNLVQSETVPAVSGIIDLFSEANPIFKSFESTMGRGIAVAINSIGLEWKLNSAPWNLEPGSRAPRMCEISLGLIPIHDITPGLDHQGINRAPIYKVGSSRDYTGDVWYNDDEFSSLQETISSDQTNALQGGHTEKHKGDK